MTQLPTPEEKQRLDMMLNEGRLSQEQYDLAVSGQVRRGDDWIKDFGKTFTYYYYGKNINEINEFSLRRILRHVLDIHFAHTENSVAQTKMSDVITFEEKK